MNLVQSTNNQVVKVIMDILSQKMRPYSVALLDQEQIKLGLQNKSNWGFNNKYKQDEPRHEKTCFLHMRKQRRRSASR